ncbi:MAG: hypothetical protein ACTSVR_11805 [Candidatus Thorarchaeota archaeon]
MANKQLYQMRWSGGQTDGDQTRDTVKELLNVEIEEFGRIRTRDSIELVQSGLPSGNNAYMSFNPTSGREFAEWTSGWMGFITSTGIQLQERMGGGFLSDTILMDTGLTTIDPFKSEIAVYGDKFFLAAVDADDNPLGAFIVMVQGSGSRFAAPEPIVGSLLDGSDSSDILTWTIQELQMDTPLLSGKCIFASPAIAQPTSEAQYFQTNIAINQVYRDSMNDIKTAVSSGTDVGIFGVMTFRDDSSDFLNERNTTAMVGLFGLGAEVDIKVQYVYHGSQISRLSNPIRFSNQGYKLEDYGYESDEYSKSGFSFGITVVLPNTINKLIKGINVYRKIIDSDNPNLINDDNYHLISTVWIDGSTIREENSHIGSSFAERNFCGNDEYPRSLRISYTIDGFPEFFGTWARSATGTSLNSFGFTKSRVRIEGDFWKTRGWVKSGATHMVYCHLHYGVTGNILIGVYDNITGNFDVRTAYMKLGGVFASTRFGFSNRIETTMIRSGPDIPLMRGRKQSDDTNNFYMFGRPMTDNPFTANYTDPFSAEDCFFVPDAMAPFIIDSVVDSDIVMRTAIAPLNVDFPDGYERTESPIIMWRDTGATAVDTEASFNGVVEDDLIYQKPRHMALAGGRFIGLNGFHDGEDKPTRAWYSQYQRFGMFNKNSYMDYGARDDGIGTGLSAFRGTAIYHFSSATYIVDVSGGFDMSWRELGAYTNIGLLHSRALAETSIGVFWCDKNDIYWFNGRTVENVSHMDKANRTIRDTYRAMVYNNEENMRVNYRVDLRQVWVSSGSDVLVLDVDKMAWHKHSIDEFGDNIHITNIIDIENEQLILVSDATETKLYITNSLRIPEFDWGITFDFDGGVPEVVKKAKRFYVDVEGDAKFDAVVTGDDGSIISQRVKAVNKMIRFSASVRGRAVLFDLKTVEVRRWRGTIESIGMSHKVKKIK